MTSYGTVPVTAIMPTFNRRDAIEGALKSVLAQTALPAEVIVIDDGSSDGTPEFLEQRFGGFLTCIKQSNKGVSAARNAGIAHASQPFVAFLDSDDLWTPDKLEKQYVPMLSDRVVLSATDWKWRGSDAPSQFQRIANNLSGPFVFVEDPLAYLARPGGHGVAIQTCLCPRVLLRDMGAFDSRYRITEDNDMIFRLGETGRFALLPEVMMLRQPSGKDENLTNTKALHWQEENLDNMLSIVEARLASSISDKARKALLKLHGRLSISRARLFAESGALAEARSIFFRQLISLQPTKETILAAAGVISPRLTIKLSHIRRSTKDRA